MMSEQDERRSRREFLSEAMRAGAAGLIGLQSARLATDFLGLHSRISAAEPQPETTALRLVQFPSICVAPQYVAEEFLRREGFSDAQYVKKAGGGEVYRALASGEVHMSMSFTGPFLIQVDTGEPIVLLAGGHIGCFELFGSDQVRTIRDLKGKTVAVPGPGTGPHAFISSMAAYVGLDPRKDINWVTYSSADSIRLLAEGKIDAFMGFPPDPQELRAKKIGHVVVNSAVDRPWSQYFCCLVAGNREFVRKHPVATKRALRAILKGVDVCAREPDRVARLLVDKGYTKRYDYALDALKMIPYGQWRENDPEDTVRFYALRLHEAGMVKSGPQKIIAQGTDWRFLNQIKKEMRG